MSDGFLVDLDALADVVARMAAFDRAVEAADVRVDSIAAGLAMTWTGTASAAYDAAHVRLRRDLRDLRTAVTGLRAIASAAHHNYAAAAAANRGMWPA
jgi:WXG100 family type VII secretion target